jgi:hypothetical protein
MACFEPALNPHNWKAPKDRYLADISPKERAAIDQRNTEIDQQIAELTKAEGMVRAQVRTRLSDARFTAIPESIREDVRAALDAKPEQRSEVQKYLAEKFASARTIADAEIDAALTEAEKASIQSSADQRSQLLTQKKTYGMIQSLWDVGEPPASHVHRRGNVQAHGVLVQAGFPEILEPPGSKLISATVENRIGETSGRRTALARWLTQPDHPLTARVLVNRIWHHHFGRGIVETLGNFGRSGSMPSHPELLDWLAVDFMNHGWSIKHLHRQIMRSTAYRQSSRQTSRQTEDRLKGVLPTEDPENRLLWRMNLRRLESEIVRDSVLAVSGSLDRTAGGPPVEITNPADGLSEPKAAPTATSPNRRSIYLFARRVYPLKFMEIFDAPIMPVNCTQRMNSATVLQSLAVLNSEFLFAQSDKFAARVRESAGPGIEEQITFAFQLAYARQPTSDELAKSIAFLADQKRILVSPEFQEDKAQQQALADLCHMLLSSNEFLYVE